MSDDAFRLTPQDVRTQHFVRALRGYDRAQIEEFRTQVAAEIERLLRERGIADERLRAAQEQLRAYRDREKALNDALIAAQELRAGVKAQAEREAELILREARAEAERVVQHARIEEASLRERAASVSHQFSAYVAGFRALLERQLAEVDGIQRQARSVPRADGRDG